MAVTGTAPWIDVEGTMNEDGSFTATGRGTMAGVPNILGKFTGTWDGTAGTLVGDYSMDEEKAITAGHPLVYRVEVEKGS